MVEGDKLHLKYNYVMMVYLGNLLMRYLPAIKLAIFAKALG